MISIHEPNAFDIGSYLWLPILVSIGATTYALKQSLDAWWVIVLWISVLLLIPLLDNVLSTSRYYTATATLSDPKRLPEEALCSLVVLVPSLIVQWILMATHVTVFTSIIVCGVAVGILLTRVVIRAVKISAINKHYMN